MTAPAAVVARLRGLPPGTRVVVRHLVGGTDDAPAGSATDALGALVAADDTGCTVLTRHGEVRIAWSRVVAGKQVPPPPPRITR